jgi:high-affinity Fe2+/Pb2+ permease
MTTWAVAILGLIGLGLMVAGKGIVSALGLVLVGIALCVFGIVFATSGGQTTITINELLLGVGVVFIAAAVVRIVIVALDRMQAPR